MSFYDDLNKEVVAGIQGKNEGIPTGFNRLENVITLRKSLYFVLGGLTGSGKSSLADDMFVLNPIDWYIKEGHHKMKLNIIYWSMERNRKFKFAKWVLRKIFLDTGVIIPIGKFLGWRKTDKLTHDEHDLFTSYRDYLDAIEEVVTMYEGKQNPIGIAEAIKKHYEGIGKKEEVDEFRSVYIPNRDSEVTLGVVDHIGLIKLTKAHKTKKESIDKLSDEIQYARDFYGYTGCLVQQFNRDISNPIRLKSGDVEPTLEDFKDSSVPQEDADVVMALFDPIRYKVSDPSKYDLNKLIDQEGKYYRSLRVIKNTYGMDDIRIGLGFLGQVGMFKELPRRDFMTDEIYESVRNKSFFLPSL